LSSPSPSFISEGLEKDILKFINIEPRTTKDVSINFKISNSKAKKLFDSLKKSGRIVQANKKGRLRLWVVEAETKRLLVES
jgi:predicted transcriptional regulator